MYRIRCLIAECALRLATAITKLLIGVPKGVVISKGPIDNHPELGFHRCYGDLIRISASKNKKENLNG